MTDECAMYPPAGTDGHDAAHLPPICLITKTFVRNIVVSDQKVLNALIGTEPDNAVSSLRWLRIALCLQLLAKRIIELDIGDNENN